MTESLRNDVTAEVTAQVTTILAELIAIDSVYPPGDTQAIMAYTAKRLAAAGYRVQTLTQQAPIANVVARLGAGSPAIVFNVHADTVGISDRSAWRTDPMVASEQAGRVYGLGAGNCKAAMAAQIWAAEAIARRCQPLRGEVIFTFVGDEESLGPNGLAYLRASGAVKPDILIVGAQTENQLVIAERGVLWVRLITRGRAAHAGATRSGDNAILRMMRVINAIETHLAPIIAQRRDGSLQSMINIGKILGGANTNVVPDFCEAMIDRRLLPTERVDAAFAELCRQVLGIGEPNGTVEIERITGTNGFRAPADGRGVAAFGAAIQSVTGQPARFLDVVGVFDGRYFADEGIEIIDFGPGEGNEGHAPNESVPLRQVAAAALIQRDVVAELTRA